MLRTSHRTVIPHYSLLVSRNPTGREIRRTPQGLPEHHSNSSLSRVPDVTRELRLSHPEVKLVDLVSKLRGVSSKLEDHVIHVVPWGTLLKIILWVIQSPVR